MSQYRLNLFIQPEHAKRLEELAARRRLEIQHRCRRPGVLAIAGCRRPAQAAIARRLDRLSRQAERLERDQNIEIETLALFIRYFLTVSTPIPEAHQDAAAQRRASSSSWNSLAATCCAAAAVRDVVEELHPDPVRMEDAAALAEARGVRHERRTEVIHRRCSGSPHPDAAHGNGAADRHRAGRPRRGGNHAQPRPHPMGGSAVVGPRPWASNCPRPMANASSAWWPRMSVRKCIAASRC